MFYEENGIEGLVMFFKIVVIFFMLFLLPVLFQNLKKEKKVVNSIFRTMHLRAGPSKNTEQPSTDSYCIWDRMLQVDMNFLTF